jgi:hypothetical protein
MDFVNLIYGVSLRRTAVADSDWERLMQEMVNDTPTSEAPQAKRVRHAYATA